jgi:hypothetical protein
MGRPKKTKNRGTSGREKAGTHKKPKRTKSNHAHKISKKPERETKICFIPAFFGPFPSNVKVPFHIA